MLEPPQPVSALANNATVNRLMRCFFERPTITQPNAKNDDNIKAARFLNGLCGSGGRFVGPPLRWPPLDGEIVRFAIIGVLPLKVALPGVIVQTEPRGAPRQIVVSRPVRPLIGVKINFVVKL